MTTETVRKLYITLRRSFAGTRETQCRTLESLGLRYREQTVIQNNSESVRGAILKVRSPIPLHLRCCDCHQVSVSVITHRVSRDFYPSCNAGAASCIC